MSVNSIKGSLVPLRYVIVMDTVAEIAVSRNRAHPSNAGHRGRIGIHEKRDVTESHDGIRHTDRIATPRHLISPSRLFRPANDVHAPPFTDSTALPASPGHPRTAAGTAAPCGHAAHCTMRRNSHSATAAPGSRSRGASPTPIPRVCLDVAIRPQFGA